MMKRARVWLDTGVWCVLFKFSLIHSSTCFSFIILIVRYTATAAVTVPCHAVYRWKKRYGQMMKNEYLIWLLLCARRLHSINQHLISVDDDVKIDTLNSTLCCFFWTWHDIERKKWERKRKKNNRECVKIINICTQ